MNRLIRLPIACLALAATTLPGFAEGDPEKGEKVFNKCKACHMVGENAKNRVGPVLNGLIGRPAGSVEGYRYSKLNSDAGENGLVWTEERLLAYLPDPTKFLIAFLEDAGKPELAKGRSKMAYKLRKPQEAEDVIAYLKQFSQD